jgi:hypothetical protein
MFGPSTECASKRDSCPSYPLQSSRKPAARRSKRRCDGFFAGARSLHSTRPRRIEPAHCWENRAPMMSSTHPLSCWRSGAMRISRATIESISADCFRRRARRQRSSTCDLPGQRGVEVRVASSELARRKVFQRPAHDARDELGVVEVLILRPGGHVPHAFLGRRVEHIDIQHRFSIGLDPNVAVDQ